ncbi:hypothetical protein [Kineosporia sp. NBRC 101731]|uniref:hypothetical protein n=1 Tax=Kineosporia sp. NBRC 101731 TaxID=3032199 RepID=UPI0024A1A67E|nr:hypothetical protein [Kineosporia sp. NBRC 101731]GLY32120.1 hypothetical protein Kisp02_54850 [Kineosporia sp. NBRC 101731]
MTDPRTPEQSAADEALTKAIEATLAAYHDSDQPFLLTDYIVITCQRAWDGEDGEPLTAVGTIHRDGDVPIHVCLGLAEYAATRYRRLIAED